MLRGIAVNLNLYDDNNDNNKHEDNTSESSGTSTDSEDEPLIENQQSSLQAIDAFLTGGKAFTHLKVNLISLLHPPLSFEHALSSESIFVIKQYISRNLEIMASNDKEKVLELRANDQSNAKIAEFLLKNAVSLPVTTVKKDLKLALAKDFMVTDDDTPKNEAASSDKQMSTSETALIQPALTEQVEQEKPLLHNRL